MAAWFVQLATATVALLHTEKHTEMDFCSKSIHTLYNRMKKRMKRFNEKEREKQISNVDAHSTNEYIGRNLLKETQTRT